METIILGIFLLIVSCVLYGINDLTNLNQDLKSQIQMMGISNLILVCVFAYLSNLYIQSSTNVPYGYLILLISLTIYLSIMAVSVNLTKINGYWLNVFFPSVLILLGFFFYILFVLPDIQFISEDSFYKAVRSLNKNRY